MGSGKRVIAQKFSARSLQGRRRKGPKTFFLLLPRPRYRDGVLFSSDFFLSLFLCQRHYEKTAGPICTKFSGKVCSDHGTTWFNFGSIRVNGSVGQRSMCLLSPVIAQRTGVNKSVSFARWQQGAGFVVPRTTACFFCDKYHASFWPRPLYRLPRNLAEIRE